MCGIVGINGKEALYRSACTTLAQLDRGTQGSGYSWINKNNKMWYVKIAVHPLALAVSQRYFIDTESNIAIGHNRFPSRGSVSNDNCHPFFDCGDRFALVHNGSITFKEKLLKRIKADHKIFGETDSEILTHLICEKLNAGKDMTKALEEIILDSKTLATVIILTKEGDLYGIKDDMPLVLCQINNTKKGNYSILASEKEAIETAMIDLTMRNNAIDKKYVEIERGDLVHISKDNIVTVTHHKVENFSRHMLGWRNGYWKNGEWYNDEWDRYLDYELVYDTETKRWKEQKIPKVETNPKPDRFKTIREQYGYFE